MLPADEVRRLARLDADDADSPALMAEVHRIRARLNPHPSGQKEFNVPSMDGVELRGIQHKYRETVLYFPSQGQSCHAYCTYCFRWAQFIGDQELRFAARSPDELVAYVQRHPEVTDVLITGGDPMVMSTDRLRAHIDPLLTLDGIRTIRIGTKSLSYWPYRYVDDPDADDVLRLFDRILESGRQLAVMAHFSHPRELGPDIVRKAIARIRSTGAVIYCQAPLIGGINDDSDTLNKLWSIELAMGAVPYYMFVERDTGPYEYFRVPLSTAIDVFRAAWRSLPGLARTIRGPVMSTTPGKVILDGVTETPEGRFFEMRMMQARDQELVGRPFRAHYREDASWLTDLVLDTTVPADIAAALRDSTRHPSMVASQSSR